LKETVEAVNKHVFDLRKSSGTDMGSTLVMAMLDGPRAYIAHVGDSRAYLVNSREIRRLTVDHSLVERLVATGQIRREEAQHHPQKNVIYRTIGDKPRLDVDASVVDLSVGDRLMLCSDGLCGLVEDGQMQKLVMGAPSPQAACEALVSAANAAGGDDNISVIVVEIIRG
ncbi:MAG TPA: SpoIIE family protein phosphatase, partial [Anaerolineaceae bacterium]